MARLYMVVETFRGGDPGPVYERLRREGRKLPAGLRYVASWVTDDLRRCFQVVESDSARALEAWIEAWRDLVAFETVEVITSEEAQARTRES